jgi:hypothetical protein
MGHRELTLCFRTGHQPLKDIEIRVGNSSTDLQRNPLCAWFPGTIGKPQLHARKVAIFLGTHVTLHGALPTPQTRADLLSDQKYVFPRYTMH